ncbi:MAG: carboxypeptidase-like regulatory domain-containing protein [Bacteroidota bacterium]
MKNRLLILLKMGSYFVACGIIIQMLLYNLVVADNAAAQNVKNVHEVTLSVDFDNASTREVLRTIEIKTDYKFIYDNQDIDKRLRISFQMEDHSVAQILTEVSRQAKLKFKQVNNSISVQKYAPRADRNQRIQVDILEQTISGRITALENGESLPGVNIVAKGTTNGTVSDIDGNYRLTWLLLTLAGSGWLWLTLVGSG